MPPSPKKRSRSPRNRSRSRNRSPKIREYWESRNREIRIDNETREERERRLHEEDMAKKQRALEERRLQNRMEAKRQEQATDEIYDRMVNPHMYGMQYGGGFRKVKKGEHYEDIQRERLADEIRIKERRERYLRQQMKERDDMREQERGRGGGYGGGRGGGRRGGDPNYGRDRYARYERQQALPVRSYNRGEFRR